MRIPTIPRPRAVFCGYCANGLHTHCAGTALRGPCECAEWSHDPDDRVAAAMRLFTRPDLLGDTVQHLADEWRGMAS